MQRHTNTVMARTDLPGQSRPGQSRPGVRLSPPAIDPRLWLLLSPALPVGGYSYSQGLEHAIGAGWIQSGRAVQCWLEQLMSNLLVPTDLAMAIRLHGALDADDQTAAALWNQRLLASRETAELRREDRDMGRALARLIGELEPEATPALPEGPAFATSFAAAGIAFQIGLEALLAAYAWVWCENQVAAAVKLVPLGQTEGQKILLNLAGHLQPAVDAARTVPDDEIGGTAPGLAIASAAHETQYTRLFRS